MLDKHRIVELTKLSERLQFAGFSWQHMDYILLRDSLPSLLAERKQKDEEK